MANLLKFSTVVADTVPHTIIDLTANLRLSELCQTAVSLDTKKVNSACQEDCVAWELEQLDDDTFFDTCRLDSALWAFDSRTYDPEGASLSSCFSGYTYHTSSNSRSFNVPFASECQSACQNTVGCSWFAVSDFGYKELFCTLMESPPIGQLMALTAQAKLEHCNGVHGSLVDCGFGSYICLTKAHELFMKSDPLRFSPENDAIIALSGPKHCRASSNVISDTFCTYGHDFLNRFYDLNTDDELIRTPFHGNDQLFMPHKYTLDEWNTQNPHHQRSTPLPNIEQIYLKLTQQFVS